MYGLDNTSGISVMPPVAPAVSPTPLWFTEGGAGQSPSYPGQDWFNMFQAEHLNVLADAGISPDKSKLNQLATAIKKLIATGLPEIPVASLSQKGIVQLSSSINSDSETLAATSKAVKTASEAALKIASNLSEIAAAGPNAVLAAVANLGLTEAAAAVANALKKSANLSDVANPAAALKNIGGFAVRGPLDSKNLNLLGNADEIGVWYQITDAVTENNNYPVRASGTLLVMPSAYGCQQEYTSYSGLKFVRGLSAVWSGSGPWQAWQQISAQQPKAVTTSDYIRIPDVPGGLIIQWFAGNASTGEAPMGPLSFPIAFPTACVFSSVSTLGNGTGSCDQMFQVTGTNRNSITLFSQVFGSGSIPGTAIPLILVIGY
ncbi:tail fiber repeat 2-containing protein [Yersinia pseudotuberculosis]|uniref:pyocin knob domain-containing protein n=1 Tax=Yersinia pseudotuberculosis TaxID=633 RepID=UPI00061C89B9|nr:pyocin knob domain-containing protein [Yersinia pseudotuberculosis]CNF92297.1 tail fiber repeat 2-containing protein [Yersinia pseudotuberculosis]